MTRTVEEVLASGNVVPVDNQFHNLSDSRELYYEGMSPESRMVVDAIVESETMTEQNEQTDTPSGNPIPTQVETTVPVTTAPQPVAEVESAPQVEQVHTPEPPATSPEPAATSPAPDPDPDYRFKITAGRKKKALHNHVQGSPLRLMFELAEETKVGLNLICQALNISEEVLLDVIVEGNQIERAEPVRVQRVIETLQLGLETELYPTTDRTKIMPVLLVLAELTKSRNLNPQLAS